MRATAQATFLRQHKEVKCARQAQPKPAGGDVRVVGSEAHKQQAEHKKKFGGALSDLAPAEEAPKEEAIAAGSPTRDRVDSAQPLGRQFSGRL